MNINNFSTGNGSTIPAMEPGTYSAVCTGVIDIGTQVNNWNGEEKLQNQLVLQFDFPSETIEGKDGKQYPYCLTMKLTKSMHEKAKLRLTLASWRGRDFTGEEMRNFELFNLLGVPATVTVTQKKTNSGKIVSSISNVGKAMKGMDVPKGCRKIYFDLANDESWSAVEEMPNWMIGLINDSIEAKKRNLFFEKENQNNVSSQREDRITDNSRSDDPAEEQDDCPF